MSVPRGPSYHNLTQFSLLGIHTMTEQIWSRVDFNTSLQNFSSQERWGVAIWPSAAQQGGDDERGREAVPPPAWRGGEGFLPNAAGESGEGGERRGGETQSDHWSQSWPLPLRIGRLEVTIPSDLYPVVSFCVLMRDRTDEVYLDSCFIYIDATTFLPLFLSRKNELRGRCLGTSHLLAVISPFYSAMIDLEVLGEGRIMSPPSFDRLSLALTISSFRLSHKCWRRLWQRPTSEELLSHCFCSLSFNLKDSHLVREPNLISTWGISVVNIL